MGRMGDRPILPVIQPLTIDTMLNNKGPNVGDIRYVWTLNLSGNDFYQKFDSTFLAEYSFLNGQELKLVFNDGSESILITEIQIKRRN